MSEQFNGAHDFGYGRLRGTVASDRLGIALVDGQNAPLILDVAEARILRNWLNMVLPGPSEVQELRSQLQSAQANIGRLHGENMSLQDQLDSEDS
jgi:hypothetical protein